jgi:SSS family solute:Na+ symporter
MNHLPAGVVGLVIAAALAAAMSTLSACINVSSMVVVNDLYVKYQRPDASDRQRLVLGKAVSLVAALLMIGGALLIHSLDILTLTDFVLAAGVIITVGIPAIFIAGMFTRRIGTAAIGGGVGVALFMMSWVMLSNGDYLPDSVAIRIPAYYVSVLGNLVALVVALLLSLFLKPRPRDLTNLTVWDQADTPLE